MLDVVQPSGFLKPIDTKKLAKDLEIERQAERDGTEEYPSTTSGPYRQFQLTERRFGS
jgi:hypothetical protein